MTSKSNRTKPDPRTPRIVAAFALTLIVSLTSLPAPSVSQAGSLTDRALATTNECVHALIGRDVLVVQGDSGPSDPVLSAFQGLCAAGGSKTGGGGGGGIGPQVNPSPQYEGDNDGDGIGDAWVSYWEQKVGQVITALQDLDADGLTNIDEFRWEHIPACVGDQFPNCQDFDRDGWTDGAEVRYWNNPQNDDVLSNGNVAMFDPDRVLDIDGDGTPNVKDRDSDNDSLTDGLEGTDDVSFPEFADSDCAPMMPSCTPPSAAGFYEPDRQGQPGTGDGIQDAAEWEAWQARGANAWQTDFDNDDIASNLLDPDSDGDSLLDGSEFATGQIRPDLVDTENDGVRDGDEVQWNEDSDGDGLLNANDTDSDNDGMPDSFERDYRFNPISALDANQDRDADGLTNLEEYAWNTDPADVDSDNDTLLDGSEVHTHGTQPRLWDTDVDGIPDPYELENGLDPLEAGDGSADPDQDGAPGQDWTNLEEYAYGRPAAWTEATNGPWVGGTRAQDPDTDDDGASDGWEAANGQPANVPNAPDQDDDDDGLTFQQEYGLNTHPSQPDTDGDGLCDGGRAPNCTRDGVPAAPGEVLQYQTDPRSTDTDADQLSDGAEARRWDPAATGTAPDTDGDGLDNLHDPDSDNDTRTDWDELTFPEASDPGLVDTDADGLTDGQERAGWTVRLAGVSYHRTSHPAKTDTDRDGLGDADEAALSVDPRATDTDNDGLCDGGHADLCVWRGRGSGPSWPGEADYGSRPSSVDSDGDGLTDHQEAARVDPGGAAPLPDTDGDGLNALLDADSDGDRLRDGLEVALGSLPEVADSDADLLEDGLEYYNYGTLVTVPDSDLDGLRDGEEVQVHNTAPLVPDTDGDGLSDGAEVNTYRTDPRLRDTDQDGQPDGWEVALDTQPRVADADQDPDADGASNAYEYALLTHPRIADTDADGMNDGYEQTWGSDPRVNDAAGDLDADGLANLAEQAAATKPAQADTDEDGLTDGEEVGTRLTDPLRVDTDADGIWDGPEAARWATIGSNAWSTNWDGDAFANNLLDLDSDNDRLDDHDEFVSTGTKPHDPDSDDDGLSDWDELFRFQGQYDPNRADTDGDGLTDGDEVSLTDADGDTDQDGLRNGEETGTYGTEPANKDSDCDGAMDGPELAYWGTAWNTGGNRLLSSDWDGDTIKDGAELGMTGAPNQGVYKTNPGLADTDGDGLRDNEEDSNDVDVSCPEPGATSSSMPASGWDDPVPGPSFPDVVNLRAVRYLLSQQTLYQDPMGAYYALDPHGSAFLVGAYGVALYPNATLGPWGWPTLEFPMTSSSSSPDKTTSPVDVDTDHDGIWDIFEPSGGPSKGPSACDLDGDGLGDGLEMGIYGFTRDVNDPCTHRDKEGGLNVTSPVDVDTDLDGIPDGVEDANKNGIVDSPFGANELCTGANAETAPADLDTDDDGVRDDTEIINGLDPACFDTDRDGLSDGLETGVQTPWPTTPVVGGTNTQAKAVYGLLQWPTWQPWQGTRNGAGQPITTDVETRDSDADGLIDALEDLNRNGNFQDWNAVLGAYELNPRASDTDADGVLDGRELLVFGTYTFGEIVTRTGWQGSWSNLVFDAGNPFETDPREANTDGDPLGLPDGGDFNPRADALLSIELPGIQFLEDGEELGNNFELYVRQLTIDIPITNGQYVVATPDGDPDTAHASVPKLIKQWQSFPDGLLDILDDPERLTSVPPGLPTAVGASWKIARVVTATNEPTQILKVNIPDDATKLNPTDLKIEISMEFMEADVGDDDRLDSNGDGSDPIMRYELLLSGDRLRPLDASFVADPDLKYLVWNDDDPIERLGDMRRGDSDEDFGVQVRGGDNIPEVFLSQLTPLAKDPLAAKTCYGGDIESCV